MAGWLRYLELKAQAKTGLSSAVVVWAVIAILCAATTFGLLIFSAFIWLAGRYSPLTAALVLTGFFLLLAILAGVLCLLSSRRTVERAQVELASRQSTPWLDPKMLGIGLQIGRAVGWRQLLPLIAIGLLTTGLAKEWFGHERSAETDDDEGDDDDRED
jgi:hypothetical protein